MGGIQRIYDGGWDPSAESDTTVVSVCIDKTVVSICIDKTVVSICIDLKQYLCLKPTHLLALAGRVRSLQICLEPGELLLPVPVGEVGE
jgi:hypothetical protein